MASEFLHFHVSCGNQHHHRLKDNRLEEQVMICPQQPNLQKKFDHYNFFHIQTTIESTYRLKTTRIKIMYPKQKQKKTVFIIQSYNCLVTNILDIYHHPLCVCVCVAPEKKDSFQNRSKKNNKKLFFFIVIS